MNAAAIAASNTVSIAPVSGGNVAATHARFARENRLFCKESIGPAVQVAGDWRRPFATLDSR